jgi:hypothetical protein
MIHLLRWYSLCLFSYWLELHAVDVASSRAIACEKTSAIVKKNGSTEDTEVHGGHRGEIFLLRREQWREQVRQAYLQQR